MIDILGETPLSFLLGAYFHQDFVELTGDSAGTVALFLTENPDLAEPLASEVQSLLSSTTSEREIRRSSDRMGSCYRANWDGGTYREWFASIEAQARAYVAEHPQPPGTRP